MSVCTFGVSLSQLLRYLLVVCARDLDEVRQPQASQLANELQGDKSRLGQPCAYVGLAAVFALVALSQSVSSS